jgi:hypothetical protein
VRTLHKLIEEHIAEFVSEGKIGGDATEAIEAAAERAFHDALPEVAALLLDDLKQKAPEMLRERHSVAVGFRRRHHRRWRLGFDLLEMLCAICEEAGSDFNTEKRPKAVETDDVVFETLVTLHARALLVANEILWLLRGGFADGALARWRTLHEIAVIAHFLAQSERETSERYLLSFHIQAHRAICQYQEYADRAGLEPFPQEEVEQARQMRDEVVARYGPSIKHEYGWAARALGKANPSLHDIERSVSLDHWRPRYKWASQYTHANYKPSATLLGMSEANEPLLLVGPSNSGLTDPAHMMAISLVQVTLTLILREATFDGLVVSTILMQLSDEIGETFVQTEWSSLERHRRRNRRRESASGTSDKS